MKLPITQMYHMSFFFINVTGAGATSMTPPCHGPGSGVYHHPSPPDAPPLLYTHPLLTPHPILLFPFQVLRWWRLSVRGLRSAAQMGKESCLLQTKKRSASAPRSSESQVGPRGVAYKWGGNGANCLEFISFHCLKISRRVC